VPDELLTIFKICFLVLLYLFFFRVLRAVWTEVNAVSSPAPAGGQERTSRRARTRAAKAAAPMMAAPAASAPAPAPFEPLPPTVATSLVAIEPPQLVGIEYPLVDNMSMGRGAAASIVLDDNFLSQRHASFEYRDDTWFVTDLGSTNGTYVDRTKVDRSARLEIGSQVQVGNIIFEVR